MNEKIQSDPIEAQKQQLLKKLQPGDTLEELITVKYKYPHPELGEGRYGAAPIIESTRTIGWRIVTAAELAERQSMMDSKPSELGNQRHVNL